MTRNWNRYITNSQGGGQLNGHGTNESTTTQRDPLGYNKYKDTQKEGTMPTDTLQDLGENIRVHAQDPILERMSDMHGWVRVYPPAVDPNEWADHSWLLTTDKNAQDGTVRGLSERIKAKYVQVCFERPHFIRECHKFGNPDCVEDVKPDPEAWEVEVPDRTVNHKDFTFDDK